MNAVRVAALQMVSGADVGENLAAAGALLAEAAERGARLVALPENFGFMGRDERDKLAVCEVDGEGPMQAFLAAAARDHGVWLVGGSIPLAVGRHATQGQALSARADSRSSCDAARDQASSCSPIADKSSLRADSLSSDAADKVFNSCLVFDATGRCVARYDKIHLFGFQTDKEQYDEARTVEAGTEPVAIDTPFGRAGLTICYDLRFPELFRTFGTADLLFVPSAFTYTTGSAHWETLLRARAIENLAWVVAPAQGGRHANGRRTWGHSMIVDPWGVVRALRSEDGAGVVVADVDPAFAQRMRSSLPALDHRKL